MRKLIVFNHVSLDGYFTDANGDMSFAQINYPNVEWDAFVAGNASGGGTLLFSRVTYELMAGSWPTPFAFEARPNTPVAFAELQESDRIGGEGYFVEPWVVIVQVITHVNEHREQINSMLSAQVITPADLDGWSYGEAINAPIPISDNA